jgi:hypothetical protein
MLSSTPDARRSALPYVGFANFSGRLLERFKADFEFAESGRGDGLDGASYVSSCAKGAFAGFGGEVSPA